MDAPDIDPDELRLALRQLETINCTLGGHSTTLAGLQKLLPREVTRFSFLDVGCGGGDTLLAVAQWARTRGYTAHLHGIELSEISAEMARDRLRRAGILLTGPDPDCPTSTPAQVTSQVDVLDLFHLPAAPTYDIVHAALVLHHMPSDREAVAALSHMAALARRGVLVNDLHRHPLAYHSIRLLTRLLSRNRILQNDAPLSVQRSFTRQELGSLAQSAGLSVPEITWRWAFRWLLVGRIDEHSPAPLP